MRAHGVAAAAFVRDLADELSFERALNICLRLLDVSPTERRAVTVRALARLNRTLPAETLAVDGARMGPFGRLARRIRGRREPALRARIEAAAARARHVVHSAHLAGASTIVAVLHGTLEPPEAIQIYLDSLDVGTGWAARIFHDAVAGVGPPDGRPLHVRP